LYMGDTPLVSFNAFLDYSSKKKKSLLIITNNGEVANSYDDS